jgi:hypothetical protein
MQRVAPAVSAEAQIAIVGSVHALVGGAIATLYTVNPLAGALLGASAFVVHRFALPAIKNTFAFHDLNDPYTRLKDRAFDAAVLLASLAIEIGLVYVLGLGSLSLGDAFFVSFFGAATSMEISRIVLDKIAPQQDVDD